MAQRQWKLEEKLEIVLLGLKGEASVLELSQRHRMHPLRTSHLHHGLVRT